MSGSSPTRSIPSPSRGSPSPSRGSPSPSRGSSSKTTSAEKLPNRGTIPSREPSSERLSMPTTVTNSLFDALSLPLPVLKGVDNWSPAIATSYSNAKTEMTCPPAYWDEVSIDHYVEKADKKLQKSGVSQALKATANPALDPLMRKRVEADVVRYGNEVLVYQVNWALSTIYPNQIESLTEYEVNGCRPDKVWKKAVREEEEEKHLFAMIESKSSESIKLKEFNRARRHDGNKTSSSLTGVEEKKEADTRDARLKDILDPNKRMKTWFDGIFNEKLMSQLSKYTREAKLNTNYAALFDSDHLFLTVYSTTDPYAIKGTMVPCHDKNVRKALLGWLI